MPKKLIDVNALKVNRFEITNKTDNTAEILIYGYVGDNPWDDTAVSAKQFSDALKSLPDNTKEIHLRINSGGGSVFDGITIYERLKQHKAKVIVYIDGLAASIASIIAMAGDEINIGEGSFLMIHKPMTGMYGNTNDFDKISSVLDKIENQMIGIYKKKTGKTDAEISKMLADETWINSDEAVDMGFADTKIEASETLHIAACILNTTKYKNRPTIDVTNKLVKTKLEELKSNIKNFQSRK